MCFKEKQLLHSHTKVNVLVLEFTVFFSTLLDKDLVDLRIITERNANDCLPST